MPRLQVWKNICIRVHGFSHREKDWKRSYKLKQKWNVTTHLLEWPKPGTLTIPSAGEEVGVNAKGTASLEDRLAASYKTEHPLIIWSIWFFIFTQRGWKGIFTQDLHLDVYAALFINYQNLIATKVSFSQLLYIQIMDYYLGPKKEQTIIKRHGGILNIYY